MNYGGYYGYSSYTCSYDDFDSYLLPYTDYMSKSFNTPLAYPLAGYSNYFEKLGPEVRREVSKLSERNGSYFAFGMGVPQWGSWNNGRTAPNTNPSIPNWNYNQTVPFNLQRFQIFDSLINGATGVWFWGATDYCYLYVPPKTNFGIYSPKYCDYQAEQVKTLSRELSSLYSVLLEPDYYDEWNVSDSRIDVMMKKHDGKIYLLTANVHYDNLYNINISLDSKYKISSVKAINEVLNGNISNVFNRTVSFSGNSFTDNFIGEDVNALDAVGVPQGKAAPGYAVHIYEIEYTNATSVVCGDGNCDMESGESCSTCSLDCGVCPDDGTGDTGSSGGGGVGSLENNTIIINETELSLGLGKDLGVGDVAVFDIDSSDSTNQHSLSVTSIDDYSVGIVVQSNPQVARLGIGDSNKFELDNDGYYDVRIKLNSIFNSKANIGVRRIAEDIVTGAGPIQPAETQPVETILGKSWKNTVIYSLLLGAAITVIIVVLLARRNRVSQVELHS